jgi:cyanophycinase
MPADQRREEPFARLLRQRGVTDLRTLDCAAPAEVTAERLAVLTDATAIWFGGGRQWRLCDAFDGTPAIAACHAVLARGGVIGGSSAGATIQGDFLVRGNPLGNETMWAIGYDRGFGFLPGVAIDQHFVARGREADLATLIARLPRLLGLGIDEGTAALVRGRELEVIGDSKLAVFDARQRDPAAGEGPPVQPVWLSAGARWDLVAGSRLER